MANRPLSALTNASALGVADLFLTTQGGNSRKATGQQLIDFVQSPAIAERVLANLGDLGRVTFKASQSLITLNGASAELTNFIPAQSIILAVTARVRTTLTGDLTSFNVGDADDAIRYGEELGITAGTTRIGVVNPFATDTATTLRLAAVGGVGSGNADKIRLVAYYLAFNTPLD